MEFIAEPLHDLRPPSSVVTSKPVFRTLSAVEARLTLAHPGAMQSAAAGSGGGFGASLMRTLSRESSDEGGSGGGGRRKSGDWGRRHNSDWGKEAKEGEGRFQMSGHVWVLDDAFIFVLDPTTKPHNLTAGSATTAPKQRRTSLLPLPSFGTSDKKKAAEAEESPIDEDAPPPPLTSGRHRSSLLPSIGGGKKKEEALQQEQQPEVGAGAAEGQPPAQKGRRRSSLIPPGIVNLFGGGKKGERAETSQQSQTHLVSKGQEAGEQAAAPEAKERPEDKAFPLYVDDKPLTAVRIPHSNIGSLRTLPLRSATGRKPIPPPESPKQALDPRMLVAEPARLEIDAVAGEALKPGARTGTILFEFWDAISGDGESNVLAEYIRQAMEKAEQDRKESGKEGGA